MNVFLSLSEESAEDCGSALEMMQLILVGSVCVFIILVRKEFHWKVLISILALVIQTHESVGSVV